MKCRNANSSLAVVHAEGAQVYECKADAAGKLAWQFREPVATLIVDGKTVGRVREQLEASSESTKLEETRGRDGRMRPASRRSKAPGPAAAAPLDRQDVDEPAGIGRDDADERAALALAARCRHRQAELVEPVQELLDEAANVRLDRLDPRRVDDAEPRQPRVDVRDRRRAGVEPARIRRR